MVKPLPVTKTFFLAKPLFLFLVKHLPHDKTSLFFNQTSILGKNLYIFFVKLLLFDKTLCFLAKLLPRRKTFMILT
jgi:hypothetical protein